MMTREAMNSTLNDLTPIFNQYTWARFKGLEKESQVLRWEWNIDRSYQVQDAKASAVGYGPHGNPYPLQEAYMRHVVE